MFAKNILEAEIFAKPYVLLINLADSRMFPPKNFNVMKNGSLKIWLLEGW